MVATKIPKVDSTTKEPGWSTKMAVFKPSSPYSASIIENQKKYFLNQQLELSNQSIF
jgi:hypothetical protein